MVPRCSGKRSCCSGRPRRHAKYQRHSRSRARFPVPYGRSELGNRKTCPPTGRPAARYPHGQLPVHKVDPRSSERRWLIDELFTSASVGLLDGPPKAFKTWVAAELALAVATGTKAFGRFAAPTPAASCSSAPRTPPPDLRTRFDGIARARRLDLAKVPLLLLDIAQLRLDDAAHLDRLRRTVALHKPACSSSTRSSASSPASTRTAPATSPPSSAPCAPSSASSTSPSCSSTTCAKPSPPIPLSSSAAPETSRPGSTPGSTSPATATTACSSSSTAAPRTVPFRLRLVPGDTPHLAIQGAEEGDASTADVDPLQARGLERLHATLRPQATQELRDALRVRKADLLAALRGLADRGFVAKAEHGWTLAAPTG